MKEAGYEIYQESHRSSSYHSTVVMDSQYKRMKPDVLMEMGIAMLDDDDEPQPEIIPVREQYDKKLVCSVAEDLNCFSNSLANEFMVFKRRIASQEGQDHFSKLSDEMVLSIFSWLPKKTLTRCSLVCRRWRRVAYDEVLWTRLDLTSKKLTNGNLGNVIKRGIRILRLAQAEIPDPVFLRDAFSMDYSARLQFLDLSMAVISPGGLATLLQKTNQLIKLSLENCTLNEDACKGIARNSRLEVLNLSMSYNLTPEYILIINSSCRSLQALNVAWTNLSGKALDAFVGCPLPELTQLNLSGCGLSLTDDHVLKLVTGCPKLLELDLSDCSIISGTSVEAISKLKVEHLSVSRCYEMPGQSILNLRNIPTLRYLDLFGLANEANLKLLQNSMPTIEINKFQFSSIARPTAGIRRTSIWGLRVRDWPS